MKERPLLFSGAMVRAILAGTKSQTRRLLKPHLQGAWPERARKPEQACPYGVPGDRLWVRETWRIVDPAEADIMFAADEMQRRYLDSPDEWWRGKRVDEGWRPSIFMPRWASRLTLEVTEVRVQRLQDISHDDAIAEGIEPVGDAWWRTVQPLPGSALHERGLKWTLRSDSAVNDPVVAFAGLWDSINEKRAPWSSNPWVWAVSFRRLP